MAARLSWQSLKTKPAILSAAAVAGLGAYYGTRSFLRPTAHAESAESPKVFGGLGFTTLRVQDVQVVNHNTKKLVFEFPGQDAKSGLSLTCKLALITLDQQLSIDGYSCSSHLLLAPRPLAARAPSLYSHQRPRYHHIPIHLL